MAEGVYKITEEFEKKISQYTGAPYVVTVDNCSNALFLSLYRQNIHGREVSIPNITYPSVPNEIIHAGGKVKFYLVEGKTLKGAYELKGTKTWDAALSFTHNMYRPDTHMCVSFTGPYKHLKLGKGGAILLDSYEDYLWFKRARFSGRRECSYLDDNFDQLGWNFYLLPELSARGLILMEQFYDLSGNPLPQEDKVRMYPDLSKFKIYSQC